MSETPRTDKMHALLLGQPLGRAYKGMTDFAGELEVMLVGARAEIECKDRELSMADHYMHGQKKIIEQMRDALADADKLIDEYAADFEHRDNVDEMRDGIKAALEAAERKTNDNAR